MIIPLIEPSHFRYIRIHPATHRVHLLVPVIAGQDISTDNTCKSKMALKAFFEGGAVSELESYKSTLEFHISLLEEGALRQAKEARLAQIKIYLAEVIYMRNNYHAVVNGFLSKPSNLYSIQLRPHTQDPYSRVVNPVFTINRSNDRWGTPLSPLYNKMHEVFPSQTMGKPDPRTELIHSTLSALPQDASVEDIQRVLTEQCQILFGAPVDFQSYIQHTRGEPSENQPVTKVHIDALMGFGDNTAPDEYIKALLGTCAPNLSSLYTGSPFYHGTYTTPAEQAERFSIMTQFYLAVLNIHCRAQGVSNENVGEILDNNPAFSQALVERISSALTNGEDVEDSIIMFVNEHKKAFSLSRDLNPADKNTIQTKFEITYRTVTATKENPHMDDFMILDTEARGEHDIFFTQKGLICTDFANIAPTTGPNQNYFAEVRQEAAAHPEVMRPQDEAVVEVEIEPEALMAKLSDDILLDTLPKEVVDACRALPAFQLLKFQDDVAKGKQDDAEAILNASDDKQTLLRTSGKFTDYSGRTFNCTAYEYAWWAKDTHMRRMLERHMDSDTKELMLKKINKIEYGDEHDNEDKEPGVAYQQHGISYKNPHYDVSFVLKNLDLGEFHHLQTMVGQNVEKIRAATDHNYQNLPFTATEYEQLKKSLKQHKQYWPTSFFYTSPAEKITNKLQFDFHSLITALETYGNNYIRWGYHEREMAWLAVGKAQRDVPAHVAHEYCRPDRFSSPRPEFNEESLPRVLTFDKCRRNVQSWFPLASLSSGLGFDFSLYMADPFQHPTGVRSLNGTGPGGWGPRQRATDLAAVSHLDEVRTADLTRSREILEMASPSRGLRLS